MSKILQKGSIFDVMDDEEYTFHEQLPPRVYVIKQNDLSKVYYFEKIDDFVIPEKIYGDVDIKAYRILRTFLDRPLSTGVLLSGVKGSGKTLLAKRTSVIAATNEIPTIVINQPHHGDGFNSFIQSINGPAVIFFDEFEKVYDYRQQNKILTLLDGVFPTKKLFIITANSINDLSHFLVNRPGRIYYNFKFDTLSPKSITEFCEDTIENKEHIPGIVKYATIFPFFTFDMLNTVVEEMNRYNEDLQSALKYLNVEPEMRQDDTHKLLISFNRSDKVYTLEENWRKFNPNDFNYSVYYEDDDKLYDSDDKEIFQSMSGNDEALDFDSRVLTAFDQKEHKFVYTIEKEGNVAELIIIRNKKYDYKSELFDL